MSDCMEAVLANYHQHIDCGQDEDEWWNVAIRRGFPPHWQEAIDDIMQAREVDE